MTDFVDNNVDDITIEDEQPEKLRDEKGRFIKGTKKTGGRRKGSKGKYAKTKLDSMLNVAGPQSLKALQTLAQKVSEGENPNYTLAFRIHGTIVEKYVQMTIYNDKVRLEQIKAKNKASDEDDQYDDNVVEVRFGSVS